ncbi:phage baseplate assembly protein V [Chachezhania antarctica]|mgnify:CR=1 FL=1|uniref:phage baseplate assembly protein V n=1 Tax=Chachezhania antarctica TaxID=2340860 RepID=UPI000EAE8801|nr:phage baseplate assembly protein V [Chachezhania antarctica]|tara:strand:+ start:4928 stop:5491 length:564 start_codon:yes stop_codon:yes gene_type:complete
MTDDMIRQLAELVADRFYGKYRGLVTGHEMLPQRGRVKVKVPAVLGETEVLAEICVPYAGNGTGLMLLPEVGSGAWVEFEGGDPSFPIWVGAFWGDGQLPDAAGGDSKRILRTNTATLEIDDNAQSLTASSDQGGTLALDAAASMTAGIASGEVRATGSAASVTKGQKGVEVNDVMTSVNGGNLDVM